ncbi:MAG: helix-turn-helix transcriptional regulator [Desulfovibrionaceae bacterium]|nr:helix-turn-helix transcriptional regulator [Desulfovibrionaceae bacterium]
MPESRVDRVALAIEEAAGPSIPAADVFPDSTPGSRLRGARGLLGITQRQLAKRIGINVPNLSAMENNRRPIGKAMAKKLGEALDFPYTAFL